MEYREEIEAEDQGHIGEEHEANASSDRVTLTVYFSGTSHSIDDPSMLASVLYTATNTDDQNLKLGFNGCGIDYGLKGILFGTGLEKQCNEVVAKVIQLLREGKRVKLNAYGHSRGAIACLLLAKMLGKFDRDIVEVNLALMDPVPGNLIITSTIDFTHQTLARQAMDLSQCRNLNQVLVIYPSKPLSDLVAHAPLIPVYPSSCQVTEELIPYCHAGAQFMRSTEKGYIGRNAESNITFNLILRFLTKVGTKLNSTIFGLKVNQPKELDAALLEAYEKASEKPQGVALGYAQAFHGYKPDSSRPCHAKSSTSIEAKQQAQFLSPLHERLKNQAGDNVVKNAPEKYAYYFSPTISHQKQKKVRRYDERKATLSEKVDLFKQLINSVYSDGMSSKSRHGTKGLLIKDYIDELEKSAALISTEALLKDILRNFLALCLQRDRNAYSPFSATNSGLKALELLNSDEHSELAEMILSNSDKDVHYSDLRIFVLGRNDKNYFNAKKSTTMYDFFQPNENRDSEQDEEKRIFSNNMNFYLA